jgi:hypothetical protein
MTSEPTRLAIIGDESSHTGHHFLAYGTVSFNAQRRDAIEKRLRATIGPSPHGFERKWNHKSFLHDYIAFVDAIFWCVNDYGLSFRCTVVDMQQAASPEYRMDEPNLALEKYIYRHLRGFSITRSGATQARLSTSSNAWTMASPPTMS